MIPRVFGVRLQASKRSWQTVFSHYQWSCYDKVYCLQIHFSFSRSFQSVRQKARSGCSPRLSAGVATRFMVPPPPQLWSKQQRRWLPSRYNKYCAFGSAKRLQEKRVPCWAGCMSSPRSSGIAGVVFSMIRTWQRVVDDGVAFKGTQRSMPTQKAYAWPRPCLAASRADFPLTASTDRTPFSAHRALQLTFASSSCLNLAMFPYFPPFPSECSFADYLYHWDGRQRRGSHRRITGAY